MQTIEINKIIIKERKRAGGDFEQLAESIKNVGLINAVTINKDLVLIAGYHRLQACKQLDWSEIPVNIIDVDNLTAELAEIDENIIRTSLTALENAEQLKRRKEIYESLHPESKSKNIKLNNLPKRKVFALEKTKSFVEDTAQKIGKSTRSIQQDVQIANNISEEVKQEIKGTEIENKKSVLLEIAKQPAEKQKDFVEKVISGQSEKQTEIKEETIISVEAYEKVKSALTNAEDELELIKKDNQKLKAEILELKKQLPEDKKEEIKNDVITDSEKIDYANRKVLVDDTWLELPPKYEMKGQTHSQMYRIANNYNITKQKENC